VDVETLVFHYSDVDVKATCIVLQILPNLPSLMHRVLVQKKRVLPLRFQTGNSAHRCTTLRLSELRQWLLELDGLEQTKEVVHDRGVVVVSIDRLVQKLATKRMLYAAQKEADPDGLHPNTHRYAAQKEAAPDGIHPSRATANSVYAAQKEADPAGVHPKNSVKRAAHAMDKKEHGGVHSQVTLDNVLQATKNDLFYDYLKVNKKKFTPQLPATACFGRVITVSVRSCSEYTNPHFAALVTNGLLRLIGTTFYDQEVPAPAWIYSDVDTQINEQAAFRRRHKGAQIPSRGGGSG
jgi:hypothetical protein